MTRLTARRNSLVLCMGIAVLTAGCAGRQITASAQDQDQVEVARHGQAETPTVASPGAEAASRTEMRPLDAGAPAEERVQAEVLPQPVAPPQEAQATEAQATEPETSQPVPPQPPAPPAAESQADRAAPSAPFMLSDAFFDFDRFTIRDDARTMLESDATALKNIKNWTLLIEGHCDERGTADYNLVLGERRAQAARRYLETLGLDTTRIQITSYGKERPFCVEHSSQCWQQNRRAHLVKP